MKLPWAALALAPRPALADDAAPLRSAAHEWFDGERRSGYLWGGAGLLSLGGVITKSSQVGTTKIALSLDPNAIRDVFVRAGLGQSLGTGFPGESIGRLPAPRKWSDVARANFAFGYGLSVTPLQLARAYSVIAAGGDPGKLGLQLLKRAVKG